MATLNRETGKTVITSEEADDVRTIMISTDVLQDYLSGEGDDEAQEFVAMLSDAAEAVTGRDIAVVLIITAAEADDEDDADDADDEDKPEPGQAPPPGQPAQPTPRGGRKTKA